MEGNQKTEELLTELDYKCMAPIAANQFLLIEKRNRLQQQMDLITAALDRMASCS